MEPSQNDLERLMLFEHARITAESNYAKNPNDADVRIFLSPFYEHALVFLFLFFNIMRFT